MIHIIIIWFCRCRAQGNCLWSKTCHIIYIKIANIYAAIILRHITIIYMEQTSICKCSHNMRIQITRMFSPCQNNLIIPFSCSGRYRTILSRIIFNPCNYNNIKTCRYIPLLRCRNSVIASW